MANNIPDAIRANMGIPIGGAVVDKVIKFFDSILTGDGNPEGVTTAATGKFYLDLTNGIFYQKTSGAGNTGWTLPGSSTYAPIDRLDTGVLLTRTTTQSIPNATTTAISWDSEIKDPDGFHSNGTNPTRATIPSGKAGLYFIHFFCESQNVTTGYKAADLLKNGTNAIGYATHLNTNVVHHGLAVVAVVELAVGDYVEGRVYQTSGGSMDVFANADYSPVFRLVRLRTAL